MNWKSVVSAAALFLFVSTTSLAQDGAALFKSKCAGCHGANGEGKPAMKAPPMKETKLSGSDLVQYLTKGEPNHKAPHKKGISGLSEDQAKAIADYISTLK
ncbi:MAG TPA: cytochrome c [Terracidiphilus sp.]|nr:cytochrome c [Terracidiphilus sp.]